MKCPLCTHANAAWYVCHWCLHSYCFKHNKRPKHHCEGDHDIQTELEKV